MFFAKRRLRQESTRRAFADGCLCSANAMTWNDVFESARSSWEWAITNDPPEGWAILIGLGLGFCAIAWQMNRGFRSLIKNQQYQAERQASLKTSQQQRRAEPDARVADGQTIAAALVGELTAYHRMRSPQANHIEVTQPASKKIEDGASGREPFISPAINTPVYQLTTPRIGLLGASLVADVVTVYTLLQMEKAELRDLAKVITRLQAFQENSADPGPVFPVERSEEAENSADVGVEKTLVTRHDT
jgi:hypothetical protein